MQDWGVLSRSWGQGSLAATMVLLGIGTVLPAAAADGQAGQPPVAAEPEQSSAPAAATSPSTSDAPQADLGNIRVTGHATGGDQVPEAYAGGQVATGGRIGVLGEQNTANVPFSVISFTSQLIENQQSHTLADVLLNDASVQSELGYGNFAQVFKIRGFSLDGEDVSFGGLYGVLPRQIVQTNFANRVELFKGSNAFANGVAPAGTGVGGAVNIEPKFANAEPLTQFRLGYQSDSQIEEALDVGRRYGDQKQYGARLSVQHAKGDTAIDGENAADTSVGLGLDYDGDRARAGLYFGYQKQHIKHGRSIVYLGTATEIPDAPDADTNYAASFNSTELENEFGLLRGEFDLTDHWTTYAAIGANHTEEQGEYGSPTLIGNDGSASVYRLGVPFEAHSFSGQAGIRGDFNTGPVSHQFNFGYSGYYRRTDSAYTMSTTVDAGSIYDPANIDYLPTAYEDGDQDDPNVRTRTRADGWAISDTAGLFDDRLLITVGGRYQSIRVNNYSYQGDFDGDPVRGHEVSPVYGVVYKPVGWLSLYANHIEALQPGAAAPNTAVNSGQVIGIAESKQNEVGAKADFGQIGGSLALYQIEKPNAAVDANNVYGYNGEQRDRGIELSVYGKPTERLRLLASATWMNGELTETGDGSNEGNDAIGVPDYRLVLSGDWQLPGADRWHANARVIRTGSQYANEANTLKLPGWTRVDLGLRYKMPWGHDDQNVVWRAGVDNVANSDYWQAANDGGYITQGQPRTFKLSATLNFD